MALFKGLLSVVFLVFTLAALLAGYCYHVITSPIPLTKEAVFVVHPGDTSYSLGASLSERGIIPHPVLTRISAKLHPEWVPKVGQYALKPDMNLLDVMALFDSGDSIFYSVTLLEGKTTQDYLTAMRAKGNIAMTLTGLSDDDVVQKLGLNYEHPEGAFFANTYRYHDGDTDVKILKHAHELLTKNLDTLWHSKADQLPYQSAYDALIMASIIEKETGVPEERPLIARVFISRLNKNMRLQTDPTVIYGLGESFDGNLTRKNLRSDSAYNTYKIYGLPPTPIANVGREAIEAALNPGETSALYFVAKGDGSHTFSDTLKQHNNAVRQYQFKRREDYRSSPDNVKQ
ncbi:endolytic transglycosylase MltG [Marinomonas sp. IMCC 4694]|uniref:endolytic transglycosylase MltG n=1 Tax=Marinomonas sp. IMCC 4694 TaxID=2605432 RepID=UPI0011E7C981|nr:endolytic transglycosylase MltG [Marinomonas sp. IMCC 4694]TYL47894.1 endolytic transglycosylase MltG [Marinomonas sp. IMCC 4694]